MKDRDTLFIVLSVLSGLLLTAALILKFFTGLFDGRPFLFAALLLVPVALSVAGRVYFQRSEQATDEIEEFGDE